MKTITKENATEEAIEYRVKADWWKIIIFMISVMVLAYLFGII
tara:strand:- start:74 stop:202 length:129 start_codon:yes stop_codon:yes gene_type:complete